MNQFRIKKAVEIDEVSLNVRASKFTSMKSSFKEKLKEAGTAHAPSSRSNGESSDSELSLSRK